MQTNLTNQISKTNQTNLANLPNPTHLTQAIPLFQDAHLLRREMLQALSDHAFQANQLLYKGYANGILAGCELTTTGSTILVNEGVMFYKGQMFLITEPLSVRYHPTNQTMILKLHFSEQIRDANFIYREVDIQLSGERAVEPEAIELCRFKLQDGARLRCQYQDFDDWNTEFDTINVIHAAFSASGDCTLSPRLLRAFAAELLDSGDLSDLDLMFCIRLLEQERPMNKRALVTYIERRNKVILSNTENAVIYQELNKILKTAGNGKRAGENIGAKKRWRMVVD